VRRVSASIHGRRVLVTHGDRGAGRREPSRQRQRRRRGRVRSRRCSRSGEWMRNGESLEEPQRSFARSVVDGLQETAHALWWDATWPTCPRHASHPLWFDEEPRGVVLPARWIEHRSARRADRPPSACRLTIAAAAKRSIDGGCAAALFRPLAAEL
jgi:hypothetical protein